MSVGPAEDWDQLFDVQLTLKQPLRFLLWSIGCDPEAGKLYRIYTFLCGAAVFTFPVLMFYLTTINTLLPKTTVVGVGVASLSCLAMFPWLVVYVRYDSEDPRGIELVAAMTRSVNQGVQRPLRLGGLSAGYAMVTIFLSLVGAIHWQVLVWYAVAEETSLLFRVIHTIVAPVAITVFVVCFMLLTLVCHLHRLQLKVFLIQMSNEPISKLVGIHNRIRLGVRHTSKVFARWMFPSLAIIGFSILYQTYGYWQETDPRLYNGAYLIGVFACFFAVMLFGPATVTGKSREVKEVTAELYAHAWQARADLTHFLSYLENADASFRVAGGVVTPELAALVAIMLVIASAVFVRAAIDIPY